MERQKVKSSNIASVGYDETTRILEVEFHNGGIYQYLNVPPQDYAELIEADSVGKFFHSRIRSTYQPVKVS